MTRCLVVNRPPQGVAMKMESLVGGGCCGRCWSDGVFGVGLMRSCSSSFTFRSRFLSQVVQWL